MLVDQLCHLSKIESASEIHECFPCVYIIVKLYLIKGNQTLILKEGEHPIFCTKEGAKGLWSVSIWKVLPKTHM